MKLSNIGDCGVICDFGNQVNREINSQVINLFHFMKLQIEEKKLVGLLNLAPSYNKLIINFDLKKTNSKKIIDFIEKIDLSKFNFKNDNKEWEIPICYDLSLDLENLSKNLKLDKEEIINIHLSTNFFIYMIGFIPGHPFMGDLDEKLYTSRLKTPRVKLSPGCVGIVEKFCNIYPFQSPGGWNIIGKTPTKLFDTKNNERPCLLSPGDGLKFKLISKEEFESLENEK